MQKYRTIQEILNGGRHLWKQMTKVDLIYTLLFCCMCLCFCEGELRCFLSYLCSCQSLFHVLNYHAGCHLSIIGLAAGRNIVLVNNQAHNSIWCYEEWMRGSMLIHNDNTSMATFSPIWAILSANNLRSSDSELRWCKIKIKTKPGDIT